MTEDPFAPLARAVLLQGARVQVVGPTSWKNAPLNTWSLTLVLIGPEVHALRLTVLMARYSADLYDPKDAWRAFAMSLSDPLIAIGFLR